MKTLLAFQDYQEGKVFYYKVIDIPEIDNEEILMEDALKREKSKNA